MKYGILTVILRKEAVYGKYEYRQIFLKSRGAAYPCWDEAALFRVLCADQAWKPAADAALGRADEQKEKPFLTRLFCFRIFRQVEYKHPPKNQNGKDRAERTSDKSPVNKCKAKCIWKYQGDRQREIRRQEKRDCPGQVTQRGQKTVEDDSPRRVDKGGLQRESVQQRKR